MTAYTLLGDDMNIASHYSPAGLPGALDSVTVASNGDAFLQGGSLSFGSFANTNAVITLFEGGTLALGSFSDTGSLGILGGATLSVDSNYTARNVSISGAGSQLKVKGTLRVDSGATLGIPGLRVADGANETWTDVVLASGSAPLSVSRSGSVEITNTLTFQGGTLRVFDGATVTLDQSTTEIDNGQIIVGFSQVTGNAPSSVTTHDLLIQQNSAVSAFRNGTFEIANLTNNNGTVNIQGGTANVHGNLNSTTAGTHSIGVQSGNLTVDGDLNLTGQHAALFDTAGSHTIVNGTLRIGGGHTGIASDFLTVSDSELDVKGDAILGGKDGDQLTITVSTTTGFCAITWGGTLSLVGNADHAAVTTMTIGTGGFVGPQVGASGALLSVQGATISVSTPSGKLRGNQTSLTDHASLTAADSGVVLLNGNLILTDSKITATTRGIIEVGSGNGFTDTINIEHDAQLTASKTSTLTAANIAGGVIKDTSSLGDASNYLKIDGNVIAGTFEIGGQVPFGPAMLMEFTSGVDNLAKVDFQGSGSTLQIDDPGNFQGIIEHWQPGATIAIQAAGFKIVKAEFVGGTSSEFGGHIQYSPDQLLITYKDAAEQTHGFVLSVEGSFVDPIIKFDQPDANGFARFHVNIGEFKVPFSNLLPHWGASVDVGTHPAGWVAAGVSDFNGDGTSDVAWFNAIAGNVDIWKIANGQWAGSANVGEHPLGYQPVAFADFNHDGTSDVLWFNSTTRDVDLWKLSNGQWAGSVDIGTHPAGFTPTKSGDFNGDGTSDIAWYNPTSNGIDVWKIANGQWAGSVDVGTHPAGYQPSLTGDFNGDGISDIAWYNSSTGDVDIWNLSSNGQWAGSVDIGSHPAGWQPLGAADFNKDGTSDIVWYNQASNDIEVWLINNGQWAASADIGTHPAGSVAIGIGDFDHNGVSDIMWRDATGSHIENWLLAAS